MAGSLYCTAMKTALIALLVSAYVFAGAARADEDHDSPDDSANEAPNGAKLLNDLSAANKEKDSTMIGALLPKITELGKTAKDGKLLDPIAKELATSYKICKGNWGTLRGIIDTLGALRSSKSESMLKKLAFTKDAKNDDQISIQVRALAALGGYGKKKYIDGIIEQSKQRETKVAVAAYEALSNYGISKGKVRKGVAENLMKRIEAEYPYATGSNAKNPGAAAIKRWNEVQKSIIAALQSVCREPTVADIDNWREWWKEYKKDAKIWRDSKKK